jgi:multimeric flavodoxin WrbA
MEGERWLKILCISAANVLQAKDNSASTKVCRMIEDMLLAQLPGARVETLPLVDLELRFCTMCGDCAETLSCPYDSAFNHVFEQMKQADAIFVVCPHYALIPAKLVLILEKLEEMAYIKYVQRDLKHYPLRSKPVGLVAHGGLCGEEVDQYYIEGLLEPLAKAFQSCGFKPVSPDGQNKGVVFGVKGYLPVEGSVFPAMDHDWAEIATRLQPLVAQVVGLL